MRAICSVIEGMEKDGSKERERERGDHETIHSMWSRNSRCLILHIKIIRRKPKIYSSISFAEQEICIFDILVNFLVSFLYVIADLSPKFSVSINRSAAAK